VALAALALLAFASLEGVMPLADAAQHLDASANAARRLERITDARPSVVDPDRPDPLPADGDLELRDVRVRHQAAGPPTLDGVDLRLTPGRRMALVGPSGAGKTTLARLLVRFGDPDGGAVALGGVDLRRLRQEEIRRAVRLGGQDAHLFATSVRANVELGRPRAGAAGLTDWVGGLPEGLDTPVGEHGAEVSGGQRRRVTAARLLLADARFLIFDEPAAHLDREAAERLLRELAAAAGSRGLLVITHTLAGLDAFDEVLVLDRGRIAERGTDAQLRLAGGRYAALAAEEALTRIP
jgi:ABC-type transport system involved in cytochrome bd biosynthesis fused ATPase/permease subunit